MKKTTLIAGILITFTGNAFADALPIEVLEQKFSQCSDDFEAEEQKCPDSWSMRCYNHLMTAHKNIQQCYKDVAVKLFENYYGLSSEDAAKKFDKYSQFIYSEYSSVYNDFSYCQQNNCGVSPYLYSEYATTYNLRFYIERIIGAVSSRG